MRTLAASDMRGFRQTGAVMEASPRPGKALAKGAKGAKYSAAQLLEHDVGETRIAKLFDSDGNQAVCLPADCQFDGDEVYATRDDRTGDVVLSKYPGAAAWAAFFALQAITNIPDDFMADRPMNRPPLPPRLAE